MRIAGHAGGIGYQVNPPPKATCPQTGQLNWRSPSYSNLPSPHTEHFCPGRGARQGADLRLVRGGTGFLFARECFPVREIGFVITLQWLDAEKAKK
ncbi:MAG: hypothetical protein HUU11_10410 [Anaerolineales bacterium]|nr:hypothetical protein [Anaerolineales bacterium]